MQTSTFKSTAFVQAKMNKSTRSARVAGVVVRAENSQNIAKHAAVLSAAAVLLMTPAAEAKETLNARQKELAYQEEMMASIKARGKADIFGSVKSSPEVKEEAPKKAAASDFSLGSVTKTTEDKKPVAAAAPAAAAPAAAVAKPAASSESINFSDYLATPAPKPAAAPAAAAPAADGGDSSKLGAVAIGAVAILGVAAAASNNNPEGAVEGAAAGAGAAAAAGASDVPANVAEARKWISAWKAKHGKN